MCDISSVFFLQPISAKVFAISPLSWYICFIESFYIFHFTWNRIFIF